MSANHQNACQQEIGEPSNRSKGKAPTLSTLPILQDPFIPLSRREFARLCTSSKKGNEYWFARQFAIKWNEEGKEETSHILDQMRNDPDNYNEDMHRRARETLNDVQQPPPPGRVDEAMPAAFWAGLSPLRVPPPYRAPSPAVSARSSMEDLRTDGIAFETPKETKALQDDAPYTPPHRLSTVYEHDGDEGAVPLPTPDEAYHFIYEGGDAFVNFDDEEVIEDGEHHYNDDDDYMIVGERIDWLEDALDAGRYIF